MIDLQVEAGWGGRSERNREKIGNICVKESSKYRQGTLTKPVSKNGCRLPNNIST